MTDEQSATTDEKPGESEEGSTSSGENSTSTEPELPERTVEDAERLTRLARDVVDESEATAYRDERDALVADHGFAARVREGDTGDVLVLHPQEWVEDGTIRVERVDDTDRAVEIRLDGPGDPENWEEVDVHNREIAAHVRAEHGDVHGDNASAFADFMSNHYARPVESATSDEVREFLGEYFPRNAWPSKEQRETVRESVELVLDADE